MINPERSRRSIELRRQRSVEFLKRLISEEGCYIDTAEEAHLRETTSELFLKHASPPEARKMYASVGAESDESFRTLSARLSLFNVGGTVNDLIIKELLRGASRSECDLVASVPFGYYFTNSPNGYAIRGPRGELGILLDMRLDTYFLRLLQLFIATFTAPVNIDDPYRLLPAIFVIYQEAFCEIPCVDNMTLVPLSVEKYRDFNQFGEMSTAFILGHEIGHIISGHLENSVFQRTTRIGNLETIEPSEICTPSHAFEFEADNIGFNLVRRLYIETLGLPQSSLHLVLATIFGGMHLLEDLSATPESTHPAAKRRDEAFLSAVEASDRDRSFHHQIFSLLGDSADFIRKADGTPSREMGAIARKWLAN